ncbi:unnamed protein product, partial [Meganyctiphanes norvegica]
MAETETETFEKILKKVTSEYISSSENDAPKQPTSTKGKGKKDKDKSKDRVISKDKSTHVICKGVPELLLVVMKEMYKNILETQNIAFKNERDYLKTELTKRDVKINELVNKLQNVQTQIDNNLQYSRCSNLKLLGVEQGENEDTNQIIKDIANSLGVTIEDKDISYSYRLKDKTEYDIECNESKFNDEENNDSNQNETSIDNIVNGDHIKEEVLEVSDKIINQNEKYMNGNENATKTKEVSIDDNDKDILNYVEEEASDKKVNNDEMLEVIIEDEDEVEVFAKNYSDINNCDENEKSMKKECDNNSPSNDENKNTNAGSGSDLELDKESS